MKICKTCKEEKPYSEYTKCKAAKDGYAYACNRCRAQYEQERRIEKGIPQKPKPEIVDTSHKECLHCRTIFHIDNFPISTRGKLGRGSYCKSCTKKYHQEIAKDPGVKRAIREATKRYRQNHAEHWRGLHRINQYNRKMVTKVQSDGTVTEEFMRNLYGTRECHWCKKYTPKNKRTAEHIIPLAKGGIHGISNLAMACQSCNSSKLNFK